MPMPAPTPESMAGFLALVLAGVLADAIRPNGYLRRAIERAITKHEVARDAHEAIPEVVEKLDEVKGDTERIYQKIEYVEEKTDRNASLIREFHGEEAIDVNVNDVLEGDEPFFRGENHEE